MEREDEFVFLRFFQFLGGEIVLLCLLKLKGDLMLGFQVEILVQRINGRNYIVEDIKQIFVLVKVEWFLGFEIDEKKNLYINK